jgi:glycine/D-amino acid oxidase-like deaminating enzyme
MISEKNPIAFADDLPAAVDVAVIGAGIVGTATAYFLAERGLKVLLCEKGRVAGEQSSRNWGWVRQQGRDWGELPVMIEANRIWRGLAEKTGEADLTFTQAGYVSLAETEAALAKAEAWHGLAKQHQLDTRLLTGAEVKARFPQVEGNFLGGLETPSDGRAEPFVAVPALARAAQRAGVAIVENCAVRSVDLGNGRLIGVVTEKGRVACQQAVLAAGAWSGPFAANAGFSLPQLAVRSTVARTEPAPDLMGDGATPNISTANLTLRRRADGGFTLASGDVTEHYIGPPSFKYFAKFLPLMRKSARQIRLQPWPPKDYPGAWAPSSRRWSPDEVSPFERQRVLNPPPAASVVRAIEARLPRRFPALKGVKLAEAWAGMIDVTPDAVPTLGEDPALPGLYIATGCSGHGFGIGPALGRIVADMVTGGTLGHDLARFRPQRFFDGSAIEPGPY